MADFGKADFGPNWCFSLLAYVFKKKKKQQDEKKSIEEHDTLRGPEGWGPEGWGAQHFRAFFPLPPPFRSLCVSLGVFSSNFGAV